MEFAIKDIIYKNIRTDLRTNTNFEAYCGPETYLILDILNNLNRILRIEQDKMIW